MLDKNIVFATIAVSDLEAAANFYIGKLGLVRIPDPSDHGYMLQAGHGTRIFIYQKDSWIKDDRVTVAFFVDDIERAVDALTAAGVVFDHAMSGLTLDERGIASAAHEKDAWFRDPNGTMLCLTQLL